MAGSPLGALSSLPAPHHGPRSGTAYTPVTPTSHGAMAEDPFSFQALGPRDAALWPPEGPTHVLRNWGLGEWEVV